MSKFLFSKIGLSLTCVFFIVSAQADGPRSDIQVATILVTEQTTPVREILASVIAPQRQKISAETDGVISSRRLEMGTPVSQGQLIAEVESSEQRAIVVIRKNELRRAEADFNYALKVFDRTLVNLQQKAISEAQFDEVSLRLEKSRVNKQLIASKVVLEEIRLARYQIHAPFDGLLVSATPTVGLYVRRGEVVFELVNPAQLRILASLTESEMSGLNRADFSLFCEGKPMQVIAHSPSTRADAVFVDVELQGCDQNLMPGQRVAINLVRQQFAHIPRQGIQRDDSGEFVYIVNNGIVGRRFLDELKAGERIIVLGFEAIQVGDKVSSIALGFES